MRKLDINITDALDKIQGMVWKKKKKKRKKKSEL